jgi:PAS domain S-box-containing protein
VYLGLLLVVILVVGVVVGLSASAESRKAVTNSAKTASARTAQLSAQNIANVFDGKEMGLVTYANQSFTAALLAHPPPDCQLSYSALNKADRGHLDLLDPSGGVVCTSNGRASALPSYAGAPWFRGALTGVQVDGLYHDPRAGWSLVIAAPVAHEGVLVAFTSTSELAGLAATAYSATQPYEFVLVSALGDRVVSRSVDPARWTGRSIIDSDFAAQMSQAVRPDLDGVVRIYGRSGVRGPGWILYTGIAESTALAGADTAETRAFEIILAGFLLCVLATWLVYRRISRPLRQLSAAVDASSPSSADVIDTDVGGPREVQVLGDAISSLSASVQRELSDRQRAEAEMRASEAAYRTLFAESPLPMWVYNQTGLLGVNEAAIALYGFESEELARMRIGSVWVDEVPAHVREALNEGLALERSGPWRHRRKDGAIIEVVVSCRKILFGASEASLLITEDVTDHERMQRQLFQTERLESLGQLAGGVAHDFNNLLGVIMSYLAFVREWVSAHGEAEASHSVLSDLDQIDVAATRAAELTSQLLAFARRESTAGQPVRLTTVIDEVRQLLSRSLGERIELVTDVSDESATVVADAGQLEQVFINLAVNARDAMPDGGTVTIRTSAVTLDEDEAMEEWGLPPGSYVRISVLDTGTGMTPDVAQHAFEPFFTTKPAGKGTGLGLSSIYGIVGSAGGGIRIDSTPGEGTDVIMVLPAAGEPEEVQAEPDRIAGPSGEGKTALVVEDEAGLRDVIRRMLERNGYTVLVAGDGPAAIALSEAHVGDIDLLLTDVVMPKMQGTELADAIQQRRPGIVVVYMTGYARDAFGESGVRPTALIEKPFREEQLLDVLRRHAPD